MKKITYTNSDTNAKREGLLLTKPSGLLNWCVVAWESNRGYAWRVVRACSNGTYTFNDTMYNSFDENLDKIKTFIKARGYTLL